MFSFPSDIYPVVEIPDYIIVLFLICLETSIPFSIAPIPIYIAAAMHRYFLFSTSSTALVIVCLSGNNHCHFNRNEVISNSGIDLQFPEISGVEHLIMDLLAICISLEKCLFSFFVYFLTGLFFVCFCYWVVWFLMYIGYEPLIRYRICKYFLPFHSLPFPLVDHFFSHAEAF